MQVAARLPTTIHRAANSRPTPELSPQAANRLKLLEQRHAMRGEGMTATKAAAILRVPPYMPLPLAVPPARARSARISRLAS